MKAVVHAWSDDLNTSSYGKLARLFRLPATMVQGQYVYTLRSARDVARWHSGLPCAGHVVSVKVAGNVATAVFKRGTRKGHKCDAPGQLAAAQFLIVHGLIRAWQQVPPPAQPAPA